MCHRKYHQIASIWLSEQSLKPNQNPLPDGADKMIDLYKEGGFVIDNGCTAQ